MGMARSQVIHTVCLDAPAKAQLRNVKKSPVLQVRYPCIGCPREGEHGALGGFAEPGCPGMILKWTIE